jgi:hypothetical protein
MISHAFADCTNVVQSARSPNQISQLDARRVHEVGYQEHFAEEIAAARTIYVIGLRCCSLLVPPEKLDENNPVAHDGEPGVDRRTLSHRVVCSGRMG